VKAVRIGARCLWRVGYEKKRRLRLEQKNDGGDMSGADDTGEVG